jgi:hypothetical protein
MLVVLPGKNKDLGSIKKNLLFWFEV